jgi:hypothetical protein
MRLIGKRRTYERGPFRMTKVGWFPTSISMALPVISYRLQLWGRRRR